MYEPSHEYPPPSSIACMDEDPSSAPRPNGASYRNMNPSQDPLVTPGNFIVYQQDMWQLSYEQSLPGPELGNAENPDHGMMGRLVPYASHPGLGNAPFFFNQISPPGQPLPTPIPLTNSPLDSTTDDVTNAEHTSISGPPQLPSFPSVHQEDFSGQPQGWKSSGYEQPLPSNTESYGGN